MLSDLLKASRDVAVVIPALNEQETIAHVVDSTRNFVKHVIVVDDGSVDTTSDVARAHEADVVHHKINQGYDKSIESGFRRALELGAQIIVTFDADGQHLAENIPMMIEPIIADQADIVVGCRPYRARVSEHCFALIAKIKSGIDDPLCGLKAYRAEVFKSVGYFDRCSSIGTELMFTAHRRGYRIAQRNINLKRRKDTPRFGRALTANYKIVKAIIKTLFL